MDSGVSTKLRKLRMCMRQLMRRSTRSRCWLVKTTTGSWMTVGRSRLVFFESNFVTKDGNGYVEDGRDIFDDDLDKESIAVASTSKGKGVKRKKKVAENAGRGNLQFMISNMPTKKKEVLITLCCVA
jgi:hypothetical protein